jgi:chromosome segregation ATPase
MTADQRLDQLEPLLSEAMTILDRHTAQLKQLTNAVGQLTTIATQQSDNISFLLREHVIIKTDVATLKTDVATLKTDVATLKTDVATLKTDVATLKTDVATLKTDVAEIKQMQQEIHGKLDLILTKLR